MQRLSPQHLLSKNPPSVPVEKQTSGLVLYRSVYSVTRENYMMAMDRSLINDLELRVLLQGVLSADTDDRNVIFYGVEQTYEGYEPEP